MHPVLVSGAAGFIGRHTCAELKRAGIPFIGVDRFESDTSRSCDLLDAGAISSLFRRQSIQSIIHLAAVLPTASSADPLNATAVNISGSIGLLRAAVAAGCRRFVFGSSTSVYGSEGLTQPISEDVPPSPNDVYGAAKRYVEIVGEVLAEKSLVEFTGLRMATVVGSGARNTSSPWRSEIFDKLGTGTSQSIALPYSPDDLLTLVHVEDVARMLVALVQKPVLQRRFYNTPAEVWRVAELKRTIENIDLSVKMVLTGRKRLAPLADGKAFVDEFNFPMPAITDRLRRQVSGSVALRPSSAI
jgi:nucleoside-diphosphate-sugar epimerase